jgi:hypothetical protein
MVVYEQDHQGTACFAASHWSLTAEDKANPSLAERLTKDPKKNILYSGSRRERKREREREREMDTEKHRAHL